MKKLLYFGGRNHSKSFFSKTNSMKQTKTTSYQVKNNIHQVTAKGEIIYNAATKEIQHFTKRTDLHSKEVIGMPLPRLTYSNRIA